MRLLAALAVAALLVFAAGCGAGEETGGAADLVPGDVSFYLVVDTDFDGDQWSAVEDLAARFPGGEGALQRFFAEIAADADAEIDFERDVKPALGPEVVVVGLEFDAGEDPPVVALTQPDDLEAFQQLLQKSEEPPVVQEVDGWQAVAPDQEALDRFLDARNGPRLSDSETFDRAMDGLDGDALVRGFVDGESLNALPPEDEAVLSPLFGMLGGTGTIAASGFAVAASDDGARMDGTMVFPEDAEPWFVTEPFEAELPETVPGDALAYVGFSDLDQAIAGFRDALAESDPSTEREIAQLEAFLGVSLEADLAPLLADEGALYVRRGAVIPEVTLVTRVEDEAQALATLDELVSGAGAFVPLGPAQQSDVDGVEVREIAFSPPFGLVYGAFDGLLVLSTSREGIAALRADGDRLADDDGYEDALDEAGVPGETTGFAYADLEEIFPLVFGLAELGGEDVAESRRYTDPLGSFVVWGTTDDDIARYSVFLGID
ncbi:MAG TPA: DUF3352 domain-containing protein [Gaiellaceae bacterium]|nr:DUF3352 domain-containing protein [Gaiellaceae bacterium]